MDSISPAEFQSLFEKSKILKQDVYGVKVFETEDHNIVKLFRLKNSLSTARLRPHSIRFARNAKRLNKLGIPSIQVLRLADCPGTHRHIAVYHKLEGELIRDAMQDPERGHDIAAKLGAFIAHLHNKGVYFRALHFNKMLLLESGDLALIDISDIFFKHFKLRSSLRLRNFAHMLRFREDRELLRPLLDDFLNNYLHVSKLSSRQQASMIMGLEALASQI